MSLMGEADLRETRDGRVGSLGEGVD
jgi:hypothetical protein